MIGASLTTRNESYWSLRDSGKLTERQEQVMHVIHSDPSRDWTRNEIAHALGWPINCVTGRVTELLGKYLEECPKRFCTVARTGKAVTPVRATKPQRELF